MPSKKLSFRDVPDLVLPNPDRAGFLMANLARAGFSQ